MSFSSMDVITLSGGIISLLFLLSFLLAYLLVSSFRRKIPRPVIFLVLSDIALAVFLLLGGWPLIWGHDWCSIQAMGLHFFLLASYLWQAFIAGNNAIRVLYAGYISEVDLARYEWIHHCFCWLLPTIESFLLWIAIRESAISPVKDFGPFCSFNFRPPTLICWIVIGVHISVLLLSCIACIISYTLIIFHLKSEYGTSEALLSSLSRPQQQIVKVRV